MRGAAALARNLREAREEARLYRTLATLRTDVPLEETLEDLEWRGARRAELEAFCAGDRGRGLPRARAPVERRLTRRAIAAALVLGTACSGSDGSTPGAFAVIADTQGTAVVEQVLLGREDNRAETRALLAALAGEDVDLVVHVGDAVFDGSSPAEWEEFDALVAPIRDRGVRMEIAPGNHEYWGDPEAGLANAVERFPALARSRWNLVRHGSLGLVTLDSNRSVLGEGPWDEQRAWFERILEELDGDGSIRGVLVFAHHTPYTNAILVGESTPVQDAFLPPFLAAEKTLAFVAGHVHGYERFREADRAILVAAGGGGPRNRYLPAPLARRVDHFEGPVPRPFHYLRIDEGPAGVEVEVLGFDKGETEVRPFDDLIVGWP